MVGFCRRTIRNLLATLLFVHGTLLLFVAIQISYFYWKTDTISLKNSYQKQQPPSLIPRIIHQIWDSTAVPRTFLPWMSSWTRHHPHWQHWFWTPEDIRCLFRRRYARLAYLYESYPTQLQRADVMRYFILHAFGGVYVDLDVESLRPLDPLLVNRSCVLSEEPHEHVHILYHLEKVNVMNTIMACRPGHPLFKELLANLSSYKGNTNPLWTTGPFYMDSVLTTYFFNRIRAVPRYRSPTDDVTVLPPKYLLPTFDQTKLLNLQGVCKRIRGMYNQAKLAAVCYNLIRRHYENKPSKEAYTNHHWFHVSTKHPSFKRNDTVEILDVPFETRQGESHRVRGCVTRVHVSIAISNTFPKPAQIMLHLNGKGLCLYYLIDCLNMVKRETVNQRFLIMSEPESEAVRREHTDVHAAQAQPTRETLADV